MENEDEYLKQLDAEHDQYLTKQLDDIQLSEQCREFMATKLGLHIRKYIRDTKTECLLKLMNEKDTEEAEKIRFEYEVVNSLAGLLCTIIMEGEEAQKKMELDTYSD